MVVLAMVGCAAGLAVADVVEPAGSAAATAAMPLAPGGSPGHAALAVLGPGMGFIAEHEAKERPIAMAAVAVGAAADARHAGAFAEPPIAAGPAPWSWPRPPGIGPISAALDLGTLSTAGPPGDTIRPHLFGGLGLGPGGPAPATSAGAGGGIAGILRGLVGERARHLMLRVGSPVLLCAGCLLLLAAWQMYRAHRKTA